MKKILSLNDDPKMLGFLHLALREEIGYQHLHTTDAMGTQTAIAEQVIEQEADYVLALKDTHKKLHQEVQRLFNNALADPRPPSLINTIKPLRKDTAALKSAGVMSLLPLTISPTLTPKTAGLAYNLWSELNLNDTGPTSTAMRCVITCPVCPLTPNT
jgi:hypothetical protein